MRAFEFTPQQTLHEQESAQIKKDIDAIIQGVKQNPENADIVAKKLAALNDAVDKIISVADTAKSKPKATAPIAAPKKIVPTAAPVESLDEATKSSVDLATQEALELSGKADDLMLAIGSLNPKNKKIIMQLLAEVQANALSSGKEIERSQNVEFFASFNTEILPKLAQKIEKELEKIAAVSPFNDEDPSQEKPGIPTKLVGKLTTKQQQNLETVQGKIIVGLQGVFNELKDKAVISGPETKDAIRELLSDFIQGVVDFGEVLSQKQGSINELFAKHVKAENKSPEYVKAFEEVKSKLYNTVIDIGKGTNMGPGELGLALILKPASKAGKGDLGYGDEVIELKGSRDPKSGARLGLEMGNKTKQVSSYQSEILNRYFPKTKPKYIQEVPTAKGGIKPVSLNLTSTGIDVLNSLIRQESNFNTKSFLLDSIMLTLDGNEEDKQSWRSMIEKSNLIDPAINSDRTIDYNKWVKALTLIQYNLYGGTEAGQSQFKTIMVFSPTSSNFRVVRNTKEFGKAIDDGQANKSNGIILSGGLSFNLDKFAKTPQVGIQ
jgi:hypothetical protein